MNSAFKVKAARDFLLLTSIVIIIHLIYVHIKSTPTNTVWAIYKSPWFFIDIIPPITLLVSMLFIAKRKNWARWLYSAYAMPSILFSIMESIDQDIYFKELNISRILILMTFLILFIFTTIIFFNKDYSNYFTIKKEIVENTKRPLSITLLSIFMVCNVIYLFYPIALDWYKQYNEIGFIYISPFLMISITSSYGLTLFYSLVFILGKEWGRTIYTVRAIPLLIINLFMLFQNVIYAENIEVTRVIITVVIYILMTVIPLLILYNKNSNNYFR